ncbi:PPE domain-containing protein [Lentzea sp. NPDC051213]|uniref:PPE domain-containing protein n=1 Tax=Lentzea sp. NPDC051213 TaxID=3364126 RepID=UPI0037A806A5
MSQRSQDNKKDHEGEGKSQQHHHNDGGYDRDDLHEPVDWMVYTHEQLYNMVHTGVNLAGAQAAATNWQKIGQEISGVRTNLLKAVKDSEVGWDSESARLARDGLTEVTNWVDDTASYALKVSSAITTETTNVEAARAAMPPPPKAPEAPVPAPVPVPPPTPAISRLRNPILAERAGEYIAVQSEPRLVTTLPGEFGGFAAVGTSPVEALAAGDAQHRLAADVMAAFQRNSAAVDQTVPSQFTPPVNPINPVNPVLTGAEHGGGRTSTPDGGAGGAGGTVATSTSGQNRGTTNTSSRGYGAGTGGGGGGGAGGFAGGMRMGRGFGPNSNSQSGGAGAGGGGGAGGAAGVNESARGAGAAAAAASSATGGQTRAFQNPLAMGGAPMGGAPAAGGGGRDDDREHKTASYLEEDDNVFGLDRKAAPPVIGQ